MTTMKQRRAAIVGVGKSRIMRKDDVPLGVLAIESARKAISDARLRVDDIEGVAGVPNQPYEVPYQGHESARPAVDGINHLSAPYLIKGLGLESVKWGANVDIMLGNSLVEAINAVEAGACTHALVYRALHNPGGTYGQTSLDSATGPAQFRTPYGIYPPGRCGWMWHAYQDTYKAGWREQMAPFVVQSRANALASHEGYWYQQSEVATLSVDDYMAARMISSPLCLLDCDIPVQASGAFVITTAERARDLKEQPAYILGAVAPYFPAANSVIHSGHTLEWEMACGRQIRSYLRETGFDARDVDVAQLYDGFSFLFVMWLEALGFVPEGEGFSFIEEGGMAPGSRPALNTNGGNLGQGRLHGVSQFGEAVLQIMGSAGARQASDAQVAVATCGFPSRGTAIVLGRDAN
jgi:acetyl-CoA acetyltransferase